MDKAVTLHVNLIPPTAGKRAVGGCDLLLCGRMLRVNPLRPVRIYQVGAHVSIAGIHDEAFSMGSVSWIGAGCAVFEGLLRGNQFPRAHDAIPNLGLALGEHNP